MKLPLARISGWAWGRRVDTGVVACELRAVEMDFDLPRWGYLYTGRCAALRMSEDGDKAKYAA